MSRCREQQKAAALRRAIVRAIDGQSPAQLEAKREALIARVPANGLASDVLVLIDCALSGGDLNRVVERVNNERPRNRTRGYARGRHGR